MIAELNSVVPTFAVSADAPSMYPIAPHFDIKSTNMYYLIHQQPQWGFRVKAARGDLKNPVLDNNGIATNDFVDCSTDKVNYPSDEKIVWSRSAYDVSKDKEEIHYYDGENWTSDQPTEGLDAAIYYNKAGFDSRVESTVNLEDKISIMPTG
jgi:hypothetical protein